MGNQRTADHELNIGSTIKRLEIARDKYDKALYTVVEETPQYRYGDLIVKGDFSGGSDKTVEDGGNKCFYTCLVDTSFEGYAIPGAKPTAIYIRDLCDYVYVDDGGAFTDESSAAQSSTADDVHPVPAIPSQNDAAYFYMPAANSKTLYINITTKGVGTWTVTWEFYNGSGWVSLVGINDGTQSWLVGSTGWKTVSWTSTLSSVTVNSRAGFWVRARVSAYTAVTTQPLVGQVYGYGTTDNYSATVTKYVGWGTSLFLTNATSIYEVVSGVAWERVIFATISDLCLYNETLYVGRGNSTLWSYTTDGDTYTQTDLVGANAVKFLIAPNSAGTLDILYSAKTPNELYYTTNGKTVADGGIALSSVAYIGDTSSNITNLFLHNGQIFIGREDGLYIYDSDGGVTPLLTELELNKSAYNFKYYAQYQGNTYISVLGGIFEISQYNTIQKIDVVSQGDNIDHSIFCTGLTSDTDYLYALLQETGDTNFTTINQVWKGRQQYINDNLEWEWCGIGQKSSTTGDEEGLTAYGGTATSQYLYYAGNGLVSFFLTKYPLNTDSGYIPAVTSYLITSYDYGTDPNFDKVISSIVTETRNCNATNYITISYRKDTDTAFTACTGNITTNGVVETNLTATVTYNKIQFKITFTTTGVATTPALSFIKVKGYEVPEVKRIHDVYYKAADSPEYRTSDIRDFLRTGRTTTTLIKLTDLRYVQYKGVQGTTAGDYVWVRMLSGYPLEDEVKHADGRQPELMIHCKFEEIPYTIS
jgi:hypothetical protein